MNQLFFPGNRLRGARPGDGGGRGAGGKLHTGLQRLSFHEAGDKIARVGISGGGGVHRLYPDGIRPACFNAAALNAVSGAAAAAQGDEQG